MASRLVLRLHRLQKLPILQSCHRPRIATTTAAATATTLARHIPRRCYSDTAPATPPLSSGLSPSFVPELHNPLLKPLRWTPPAQCPGCGAPSQFTSPELPGFYKSKPRVKKPEPARKKGTPRVKKRNPEAVYKEALERAQGNPELLKELGLIGDDPKEAETFVPEIPIPEHMAKKDPLPVCERCHELKFHHAAPSLPAYPTLDTLSSLILSSRHKHNHIYHLVDAADFPLSLRPDLLKHLRRTLPKAITRNLTVSYVITRCDILVPKREQTTSLMTYLKMVIKDTIPEGEKVEDLRANSKLYAISTRLGCQ